MRPFTHAPHIAALLLSFVTASWARADWLNYSVAVSNSASGPFASDATLWTQSAPPGATPSTITLTAESAPVSPPFAGQVNVWLGHLTFTGGNSSVGPADFPQIPFAFQVTPQGKKSLILSGQLSLQNNGMIQFANGGSTSVTVGTRTFDVTLEAMQSPMAQGEPPPGDFPATFSTSYDVVAVVSVNDLAHAPEPSGLVLAGIGVVAVIGMARRRPIV